MKRGSNITTENRDWSVDSPDSIWKVSSSTFGPQTSYRDKVSMILLTPSRQMLPSHSSIRQNINYKIEEATLNKEGNKINKP
jgi:hypothetical protein